MTRLISQISERVSEIASATGRIFIARNYMVALICAHSGNSTPAGWLRRHMYGTVRITTIEIHPAKPYTSHFVCCFSARDETLLKRYAIAYRLAAMMVNQITEEIQYSTLPRDIKLPGINASKSRESGIQANTSQRVHLGTNLPSGNKQKSATVGVVKINDMKSWVYAVLLYAVVSRTSSGPGMTTA